MNLPVIIVPSVSDAKDYVWLRVWVSALDSVKVRGAVLVLTPDFRKPGLTLALSVRGSDRISSA